MKKVFLVLFMLFAFLFAVAACTGAPVVNRIDPAAAVAANKEMPLPISPPVEFLGEWEGEMETRLFFEKPTLGGDVLLGTARREVRITIRLDGGATVKVAGCQIKRLKVPQREAVVVMYFENGQYVLRGTKPFQDFRLSLDGETLKVEGFSVKLAGLDRVEYPDFFLKKLRP